jgi:hypothetical protein
MPRQLRISRKSSAGIPNGGSAPSRPRPARPPGLLPAGAASLLIRVDPCPSVVQDPDRPTRPAPTREAARADPVAGPADRSGLIGPAGRFPREAGSPAPGFPRARATPRAERVLPRPIPGLRMNGRAVSARSYQGVARARRRHAGGPR